MRRLFAVVVLVTMSVTGGGAADPLVTPIAWWQPADPDALVKQGRTLVMAGKHDEAFTSYQEARAIWLRLTKSHPEAARYQAHLAGGIRWILQLEP